MIELILMISVGELKFGEAIGIYTATMTIRELPEEYSIEVGWNVYEMKNPLLRIFVENDKIISIACYEECYYLKSNLIGLKLSQAMQLLDRTQDNADDFLVIDGKLQYVYDIEDIGIQLWVENDQVVTIIVNAPEVNEV